MQRHIVQVIQVRLVDLKPGDICNKRHDATDGWFRVRELEELPNGGVAVLADSDRDSINGSPFDIVGVQLVKAVEIPDSAIRAA